MVAEAFISVLASILSGLYFVAALYIFFSLVRQIRARTIVGHADVISSARFGWPETILAVTLVSFLLLNVIAAIVRSRPAQLNTRDLVANLIFFVAVVLFIASFLRLRRFDLESIGGFSRISFVRAVSTGVILLFFTYPLLAFSGWIVQVLFGIGAGRQEIVDLFTSSQTLGQRILIVILAVIVAPIAEEFIFRLFLYGVLKRFLGFAAAVLVNALLFAAVHTHLPSLAPLFVLGACFTLAYEWSGSILVSMTMHALFNGVQLILLAFPQLIQQ